LLVKQLIREAGHRPIIPRRQGALFPGLRPEDKPLYRTRVTIEPFFARLKENKRLALRFDPLDIPFFSFFALAYLSVFRLLCSQGHIIQFLRNDYYFLLGAGGPADKDTLPSSLGKAKGQMAHLCNVLDVHYS
jgi:hypothetical protein